MLLLTEGTNIPVVDFLSIAKHAALTTFAPTSYVVGQSLEPCKPPIPTEDMIRRSILYHQRQLSILTSSGDHNAQDTKNVHSHNAVLGNYPSQAMISNLPPQETIANSDSENLLILDLNP